MRASWDDVEEQGQVSRIQPQPGSSARVCSLVLARGLGDNLRMSSLTSVAIHTSQFPKAVRRDLLQSLASRQVSHKFHYDSVKQTHRWLALHQACSPSRSSSDCLQAYGSAFATLTDRLAPGPVHVVGLGCGGGQKDTKLLALLKSRGREVYYTPSDVSLAMTLVAREAALSTVGEHRCFPLVCDLAHTDDLADHLEAPGTEGSVRVITFFGMIPNFEPGEILSKLSRWLRPGDHLLFSANLAPGLDYPAAVHRILPQYDNPLTREWLMTFLTDLGVEPRDGELGFGVEPDAAGSGLLRIAARFRFSTFRRIRVEGRDFDFQRGEDIRLFYSYRYTPERVRERLGAAGVWVDQSWEAAGGEEGVFLCRLS